MTTEAPAAATGNRAEGVGLRVPALDRVRGLAVLLMVFDHLLVVTAGPFIFRETITRAAMPLFFLLGGFLVRRLSWRLAGIGLLGLLAPLWAPAWIDRPNVLLWFALCAPVVLFLRRRGAGWLLAGAAVCLTFAANGYGVLPASYAPAGLLGLMLIGALAPLSWFAWGDRLPAWVGAVGRFPVSVYVGHLLLLGVLW